MKILTKVFLALFLCLFVSGCAKNENQDKFAKPIDTAPILEISQDAKGLWDVRGKTLFLRLYDNGFVEFEYPDNRKKTAGFNEAEKINTLKQIKVSKRELQKFLDLLNSEEFQKIQDKYERKYLCMDTYLDYKINLKYNNNQRNILLNGFCDIGQLKNPQSYYVEDFPKVLSELMTLVDNTRWKNFPR